MAELPSKLFFRIGEVAGLVGVEPHVLRYWEREFRSIRPTKSAKGQRVYSRKDVENLLRVRDLLYRDGFTIAGAKKKLSRAGAPLDEELAPSSGLDVVTPAPESDAPAETERDALAVAEPMTAAAPPSRTPQVRAQLVALRDEVEGFLAELGTPAARGD